MKHRLASAFVAATVLTGGMVAGTAIPASASTGQLGGMNIAAYCQSLGDFGTTATGPATLRRNAITGPNYAYNNWACVQNNGTIVPIASTGPAPSMTDVCAVQYPGVASYAFPTDPNDAYSWNCYSLPPAAGPGLGQQLQAAVSALMASDAVQAEIAHLQSLVAAGNSRQALAEGVRFLAARPQQELINDVLGGYKLTQYQGLTTVQLGIAMTRAVLHQ